MGGKTILIRIEKLKYYNSQFNECKAKGDTLITQKNIHNSCILQNRKVLSLQLSDCL